MAICEVINPSDQITLSGENYEAVALAVMLMGEGKYGAREIGGDCDVPPFLFGGHDEWMSDKFGRSVSDSLGAIDRSLIASVLESAVIGNETSRIGYEKVASKLDGVELEQWRDEYHDRERSSMNDICGRAWAMAKNLRNNG